MPIIEETVIDLPTENAKPLTVDLSRKPEPTEPPVETQGQEGAPKAEEKPAPQPPEKTEEKEDPKFSARFAALTRKEREIVQKERQLKEISAKVQAYEKALQEAKTNPIALLQAAGFKDLEDYLKTVTMDAPPVHEQKLSQIEQKILAYEQQMKEAQLKQHEAVKQQQLNQIHNQINDFISQNSDQYELIKEYNAVGDVWNLIERVYIETQGQTHLTMEQAAAEVEKYYFERAQEEQQRLSRIKKFQPKQTENKPGTIVPPTKENTVQVAHKVETEVGKPEVHETEWNVAPTLTNTNTSIPQPNSPHLTREQRIALAASKIKWTDD
jgi:hypothetical protein